MSSKSKSVLVRMGAYSRVVASRAVVEFRRTMSSLQVKNQITKAFPSLKLDNPVFMKCVDLKMVTVDMESGYPCSSNIQNTASKESLYF